MIGVQRYESELNCMKGTRGVTTYQSFFELPSIVRLTDDVIDAAGFSQEGSWRRWRICSAQR